MATAAQITANRSNAQRSTGPTTDAGKVHSAQNARRHGFTAKNLLISDDDRAEFEDLEIGLRESTHPTGLLEEEIFHRILTHTWNLRRVETFESQILAETNPLAESDPHGPQLERYARYRRDLERSLYRAMSELRKLQTERAILMMQHATAIHAFSEAAPMAELTRLRNEAKESFGGPTIKAMMARENFLGGIEPAVEYSNGMGDDLARYMEEHKGTDRLLQFRG